MIYKDWTIPAGTPVGMTSALIHQNADIFYEPESFIPERWIENPKLDQYLLSFSKGTRQCAGIAYVFSLSTCTERMPPSQRLCGMLIIHH